MRIVALLAIVTLSLTGCLAHSGVYKNAESLSAASEMQLATAYSEARHLMGADSEACRKLRAEMVRRPLPRGWEWQYIDTHKVAAGMSAVAVEAVLGHERADAVSDYNDGHTSVTSRQYQLGQGGLIVTMRDGVVVETTRY